MDGTTGSTFASCASDCGRPSRTGEATRPRQPKPRTALAEADAIVSCYGFPRVPNRDALIRRSITSIQMTCYRPVPRPKPARFEYAHDAARLLKVRDRVARAVERCYGRFIFRSTEIGSVGPIVACASISPRKRLRSKIRPQKAQKTQKRGTEAKLSSGRQWPIMRCSGGAWFAEARRDGVG